MKFIKHLDVRLDPLPRVMGDRVGLEFFKTLHLKRGVGFSRNAQQPDNIRQYPKAFMLGSLLPLFSTRERNQKCISPILYCCHRKSVKHATQRTQTGTHTNIHTKCNTQWYSQTTTHTLTGTTCLKYRSVVRGRGIRDLREGKSTHLWETLVAWKWDCFLSDCCLFTPCGRFLGWSHSIQVWGQHYDI